MSEKRRPALLLIGKRPFCQKMLAFYSSRLKVPCYFLMKMDIKNLKFQAVANYELLNEQSGPDLAPTDLEVGGSYLSDLKVGEYLHPAESPPFCGAS